MKTNRSFRFTTALFLFGGLCAFASAAQTETSSADKTSPKAKSPRVTTEVSHLDPATEQVVVTEKYRDGTVIRVVQILHQDGTSETRGERHVVAGKS